MLSAFVYYLCNNRLRCIARVDHDTAGIVGCLGLSRFAALPVGPSLAEEHGHDLDLGTANE